MKIKHKTNLLLRFATVFLFVALTFACKQSNKNKPQTPVKPESPISKEGEIEIKVKKGEEYVALNAVLPKSGIPYTATEKEINPEEKIVLKVSAKDATYFKAKIVSPEKDAPLAITGSANLFDVVFKKVNKATPVQIRFSYSEKTTSQNIIYKDVKIIVLPEPAIEKVEAQDVNLIIGVDHDITQTPLTFITSPEKIGEIKAIDYILQDSKKITYGQSSDTTVATIDGTGKVHTVKNGETNIPLLCNNVKKGDLKIIVEDKCIPKKLIATPNHVKLKVGKTQDIVLTATPNNAVLDIGDWRNDNPEVGKIEKKGNDAGTYTITALKKGRVSFSATSKYSYNVFVFVTLEASDEDDVEKVELDKKVAELVFNESVQLTAKVFPATASQEVAWKKESIPGSLPDNILTHVVATGKVTAKDNTGYLKVVALSVKDGTKQDECLISIASRKIEKVTTTQNEITMLTNAESMFECEIEPLGAADKLECMGASDNLKVKMAKINDTNKYSCTLKAGENAEDIKLTFFCPTNPDKKVEVTVHIKKVAGSIGSLSIEGEEAMYISETVEFTNKLTGNTSSIPNAEKAVEWTLQGNTNITEYFLLTKKDDGSVSLTIPAEKRNELVERQKTLHGKKLKLICTSTIDSNKKAEKTITIYNDISTLKAIEKNIREYTITSVSENEELWNKDGKPELLLKFTGEPVIQHKDFLISTKKKLTSESDYENEGYFETSRFSSVQGQSPSIEYDIDEKTVSIELKPKKNTQGKVKVFYIHPIDPKTGKVSVSAKAPKSFILTIWDEPTGIELIKGNFEILPDNKDYKSEVLTPGNTGYYFTVKATPEFSNPVYELHCTTRKINGKHLCIQNAKFSTAYDTNGWKISFDTNPLKTSGDIDMATFNFSICVIDKNGEKKELNPPIKNYLLVISK